MATDNTITGKIIRATTDEVNVRKLPSTTSDLCAQFNKNEQIGRATGNISNMSDGKWIQLTLIKPVGNITTAYVKEEFNGETLVTWFTSPSPTAENNAQAIINATILNDKKTYSNLADAYRYYQTLKKYDIPVPEKYIKQFTDCYISLQGRQQQMLKMPYIKCSTGRLSDDKVASGMNQLVVNARGFSGINNDEIGDVILTIIIVAILIGAAVGAYYAFKPCFDDSKVDLKVSDLLQKALNTLTPSEQKEVKEDLQKQLDDANKSGKQHQWWTDNKGFISKIVVGVGAFFLAKEFIFKKKSK